MINISSCPKVSIICRTYNQENFIDRAIQSVLNQTYENWELIVIDDASTDATHEKILKFQDNRMKVLKNFENKGPLANLNIGMKSSEGEYIAILDGDDEYLPQKLEKQVYFLNNNPDYGAVFSYINTINETGNFSDCTRSQWSRNLLNNPAGTQSQMLRKCFEIYNFLAFPTEMFRKEYAIYFNEHLLSLGDGYFHISTLLKTKIKVLEEPLTNYRILENSVTFHYSNYSHTSEKFFVLDKFLEIENVEFFKEIFKDDLGDFNLVEPPLFPYILTKLAEKYPDKRQWANYNFHRFISNIDNYNLLKDKLGFSYKDIMIAKYGILENISEKEESFLRKILFYPIKFAKRITNRLRSIL
jgi:glycosyltransferase involved in cell wall biosynthesis